jgi:hypothetical protein
VEHLHLKCQGVEIPILVEGSASGPFTQSNALVYYGQRLAIHEKPEFGGGDYSERNVYYLYSDLLPGRRMLSVQATPTTGFSVVDKFNAQVHVEVNNYLDSVDHFRLNGDNWFWLPILFAQAGSRTSRNYTVSLLHPVTTSPELSVSVVVASLTAGPHSLEMALNGVAPSTGPIPANWLEKRVFAQTWEFSSGMRPGPNTVTLTLPGIPGGPDAQFLDYLDFSYPRTFDADDGALLFTDANADAQYACPGHATAPYILDLSAADAATGLKLPVLLTGATFENGTTTFEMPANPGVTGRTVALSSAPLLPDAAYVAAPALTLSADNAADMVIVTHPDFHPAGSDLVWQAYLARRSASMRVMTVDIEQIYDAYSYGLVDPTAIRSFLQAAAAAWGRPPKYVLLVGDASYDYKNYTGDPLNKNWVPTMMFEDLGDYTYMGRYPSDAWFADVDGDGYPDSAVGRLPARSYAEFAGMLTKIMAYENQDLSGTWYKSATYLADTWTQDWEQVFEEANDALRAAYTPPPWGSLRLYFHDAPWNGTDADGFAAALRSAWPSSALMHYSGHSGISSLGNHYAFFTSYPSRNCTGGTCSSSDVDLLPSITLPPGTTWAPLPFVVSSSCYNSAFDELGTPALMKDLILRGDRGTIGSCGFSTIAYPDEEHTFANAFFELAFGRGKVRTAGDLVEAGRFSLPSSDTRSVMGNILLGDPTVALRLPAPPPPATLTATPADGAALLAWDTPPVTPGHFALYRSEDGGATWGLAGSPSGSDRSYTDGGLQNGKEYAYTITTWDGAGFEGPTSVVASATPEPGLCTVTCQAQAAGLANVGAAAAFTASAAKSSCLGDLTYEWDFGDSSPHAHTLTASHTYGAAGQFDWRFTATADGVSCSKSGSISVVVPPVVTGVKKAGNPFRIIITGTGLKTGLSVQVAGQPWTTFVLTPETQVKLKGSGLKALFPPSTFVPIRLLNADGGEVTVSFNRTTGEWH